MEMYKLLDELYRLMMEEKDKHTALVLAEAYKKLKELERDAARYWFFASRGGNIGVDIVSGKFRAVDSLFGNVLTDWHDSFDAAIDAAMGEAK